MSGVSEHEAVAGEFAVLSLVRSDGTGWRKLTDDIQRDRMARWSPDGSSIAFFSDRSGSYEIWTINPDKSFDLLLGGILPIEEFLFFLLTNTLVTFGVTLVLAQAILLDRLM